MPTQVYVKKSKSGWLDPCSPMDLEAVQKLSPDRQYRCDIVMPRSNAYHNRYWGKLHVAVESTVAGDYWPTAQKLHQALLVMTGHVTPVKIKRGGEWEYVMLPDSTAFDRMDQGEFQTYADNALMHLSTLIGVPVEALDREAVKAGYA